jgi:ATP-dependent exoDNAse (exonuclease V) beta subunit
MVRFEKERHKYFHIETGEEYKSVTTILGLYEPHFDSENIAKAVARKDGRTKEDVLAEWKHINQVANDKGNFVHNLLEKYLKCNRLYVPKTPKEKKLLLGFQKIEHQIDYGEEYYPEKILWNDEYKVAGMSDLIVKNDDEYFSIIDYKTNKKFNFYSPYNKHLLEPLSHLQDCQYTVYSLQLSIYAYLYEQISGLKCKRLIIGYLADSEEFLFKIFPIIYLRNDVKILLNHYKENYL